METKICIDCKEPKLLEEFPTYVCRLKKHIRPRCRPCHTAHSYRLHLIRKKKLKKNVVKEDNTLFLMITQPWDKNIFKQ